MKELDLPVAKEVLRLCRLSFDQFKKDQPTGDKWKLHYFLILTLLRTVREGLNVDKDDLNLHPHTKNEIENFFQNVKTCEPVPKICWDFITQETNKLLHDFASPQGARQSSDSQGNRLYIITTGPFKGRDQECVIEEAINWWDEQLEDIECKVGARRLIDSGII